MSAPAGPVPCDHPTCCSEVSRSLPIPIFRGVIQSHFLALQYSRHLSYFCVMTTLPVQGFPGQVTQWRHLRICIKSTPVRDRTRSHHPSFPSTRRCVLIAITPRQRRKTQKTAKRKALEDRRWLRHPFSPPPFEARGGNARMKGAIALSFQQDL
jgi:hypothetical protein